MMGQKFVQLLANHPWLEVSAVAASDKSVGKPYAATVGGQIQRHVLDDLGDLQVVEATPRALRKTSLRQDFQSFRTHHRTEWTMMSHCSIPR